MGQIHYRGFQSTGEHVKCLRLIVKVSSKRIGIEVVRLKHGFDSIGSTLNRYAVCS